MTVILKNDRDVAWALIAKSLGFSDEPTMLLALYDTASIFEIAKMLKTTNGTVLKRMERHNIERRPRGGRISPAGVRYKMFHVDQRVILFSGFKQCCANLKVSTATLYKYKQWKYGRLTEMSGHIVKRNGD